jgi:hypothetical protein
MPTITVEVRESGEWIIEKDTGRIFDVVRMVTSDGVQMSKTRNSIEPDADLTDAPTELQELAVVVRTPERLARAAALRDQEVVEEIVSR